MLRRAVLLSFIVFVSGRAIAQEAGKPSYKELLDQVKKMESKADFAALRMAYTQTADYKPYEDDRENRDAMREAFGNDDFEKAIKHADALLNKNYVDIEAHRIAARAYGQLDNEERARFHEYVRDGLLKSIVDSGNGKTAETAFVVINTSEEYALMRAVGFKNKSQGLMEENGHSYDVQEGVDGKGEPGMLYFNIDRPFKWLGEALKKKD